MTGESRILCPRCENRGLNNMMIKQKNDTYKCMCGNFHSTKAEIEEERLDRKKGLQKANYQS